MILNANAMLSQLTTCGVWQSISTGAKRPYLGNAIRKTWFVLCSVRVQRALAWLMVFTLLVVDSVLVGQHALARYQTYHADAFDLGNMDQAIWNTLHGHPLRFTNQGLDWVGPPTRLGVHVEPILLLIAPLYLLHSGPETLLLLQTLALSLGGIPLLLLGLRRLPDLPLVAAAFVAAYLAAPEILGEALWDFHAVALATPLLLLALWALDAQRFGCFALAAGLAALCKEEVALSLVPLGFFIAFRQGHLRLGMTVSLLSLAWVALCFLVIVPHYNAHTPGANAFWYRYDWLGSSPDRAVQHVLSQPALLLAPLEDPTRREYLAVLLRTGGGLGLFAPALWLSALPDIVINTLSTHQEQYSGFYQYNAVILPYLLVAALSGTAALYHARKHVEYGVQGGEVSPGDAHRSSRPTRAGQVLRSISIRWQAALGRLPIRSQWISLLVIAWLLASSFWNLAATSAYVRPFWLVGSHPNPQQAQIDALLASVPPAASVAATDTLNPHLSDRYTLFLLPDPQSYSADYVAIDLPDATSTNQQADQLMYAAMLTSGNYRVVGTAGNVVLLQHLNCPQSDPYVRPIPEEKTASLAVGEECVPGARRTERSEKLLARGGARAHWSETRGAACSNESISPASQQHWLIVS